MSKKQQNPGIGRPHKDGHSFVSNDNLPVLPINTPQQLNSHHGDFFVIEILFWLAMGM